jgi:hypothetical protein
MIDVNWWVVPVAAISSFALGGAWYSPLLFGQIWAREMDRIGNSVAPAGGRTLAGSFAFTLIEVLACVWLFNACFGVSGFSVTNGLTGFLFGLMVGVVIVASSTGINYLFSGRTVKLWMIDGGFNAARYGLYGFVLGAWR